MTKFVKNIMCCVLMITVLVTQQVVMATEMPENTEITEVLENIEESDNAEEAEVSEVNEVTESTETEEGTEVTESTEKSESTETVEEPESTEAEETEPEESTEELESTETEEGTEVTESTEESESTEEPESTETEEGTEVTESTEAEEAETEESTEEPESTEAEETEPEESIEEPESTETEEGTEVTESTEESESTETVEESESTEIVEETDTLQIDILSGVSGYIEVISEASSLKSGDIVEVELYVNNINMTYWEGYLAYDAEIFELDKSADVILPDSLSGWSVGYSDTDTAFLSISASEESGDVSANGLFATIRFHVKETVSSAVIQINNMYWRDAENNDNTDQLETASVSIQGENTLPNTEATDNRELYLVIFIMSSACMVGTYFVKRRFCNES